MLRARAKAAVFTSPRPAELQKLGVPQLAEGLATGGCAQVGAPISCAGAVRRGFREFPWTRCAAPGDTRVDFGLGANLVLGLTGLWHGCGPSEGCGPLTSGAGLSTGL